MLTTSRSLNDGWYFREQKPAEIPFSTVDTWLPAEVPGHVHLDLMRLGIIPDPFERMYERSVQWVDQADWAYRRTFDISAGELEGARHLLHFAGLDTVARVLLNDVLIGELDNMFVPHEFDVTALLRPGANTLEVRFASAQRVGDERRAALLATQPELAVFERGLAARSMVRKAQYMYGWDWGPCLRGCGIWQDVSLLRIPRARIYAWNAAARFADDGTCRLAVRVWVDGGATDLNVRLSRGGQQLSARAEVSGELAELEFGCTHP